LYVKAHKNNTDKERCSNLSQEQCFPIVQAAMERGNSDEAMTASLLACESGEFISELSII
jgi:hypothetical protein